MSSLFSLQSDMIKFCCAVNTFVILCKIWSTNFFCTFYIFFLSTIFIMISCFLQSNNKFFLSHCICIIAFSLVISVYDDVISDVKCIFSYIYNCLLSSWMNVFNFYTFFSINKFRFLLFLSFKFFQRRWISFKITFFHK